ncbi:MAG TPA: site-specific integrase, partial [Mycobacterium sp.]|nr:site-specific integrase [Mycobacterium sp.]
MIGVDTSQMAAGVVSSPVAGSVKSTGAQLVAAFPPRPVTAWWPATEAGRSAVADRVLAAPFALDNPLSQRNRRLGVLAVLGWLRGQPGDSWQQRWRASGAEGQPDWRLLVGTDRAEPLPHLTSGLLVLICADVIRPSLEWLLRFAPARHNLAAEMARTRDGAAFAELSALCQGRVGLQSQQQALTNVAIIMAVKGGNVAAVHVGDCLELLAAAARTRTSNDRHAESPLFYQLLRAHGDLGPDAPAAIEMFFGRGQPSCEQLIDRYRIACGPVRDVLVDYLRERQPAVDFSTLQRLAYLLGKLFWADLEAYHPGIDSLQLPREVAAVWKQRVLTRPK